MLTAISFQQVQNELPGKWERDDKVLSMCIAAPIIADQKHSIEFTVPVEQGLAISVWDFELVKDDENFWMLLTNRSTRDCQSYRIDVLEKDKALRLHAKEGYEISFHPKQA